VCAGWEFQDHRWTAGTGKGARIMNEHLDRSFIASEEDVIYLSLLFDVSTTDIKQMFFGKECWLLLRNLEEK
jgi:hypothetical protein